MEMKLCPNNHYYDRSVHKECPYCALGGANIGATMPASDGAEAADYSGGGCIGYPRPPIDNDRTHTPFTEKIGIDPVVGWLVCLEGKDKGRDYRIHADNNFIGRSRNMDIVILNDDTVSRENHAIISYDTRDKVYYFAQGSGRGIVRVNDKAVLTTIQIVANDRIEIGNTKLMFIPLCGEEFDWLI